MLPLATGLVFVVSSLILILVLIGWLLFNRWTNRCPKCGKQMKLTNDEWIAKYILLCKFCHYSVVLKKQPKPPF